MHVPGFLSVRQTVPPAGTGPGLHLWSNQSRVLGLFGLCEKKGDRPPAIGACPLRVPSPAFQLGAKYGFFHVGLISLRHQQILNETQSRLKHICCHIVPTVVHRQGESVNTSRSVTLARVCVQSAIVYTRQIKLSLFTSLG